VGICGISYIVAVIYYSKYNVDARIYFINSFLKDVKDKETSFREIIKGVGSSMVSMAKYGKMLLNAYFMKKIISSKSKKGRGLRSKYVKLFLLGYILKKLSFKAIKPIEHSNKIITDDMKLNGPMKRSEMKKFAKIILGSLLGAIAIYALRKHSTRKVGKKIEV